MIAKTAFISHASEDEAVAHTISGYLERNGVSCWIAPRDVRLGADYASEIIDGIEASAVFVLVLSEHANASTFVKREVERAVSKGKPVFPVRVREVLPSKSLELFISSTEWIDAWQPPIEQYLERLAASIRSAASLYTTGRPEHAAPARDRLPGSATPLPAVASGRPDVARHPSKIAVAALIGVVAVLGVLLVRTMTPEPAVPESPAAAAPATRPTARIKSPVPSVPKPTTPERRDTAISESPLASDPCPRSISINRELPMPFSCRCTPEQSAGEATVWGTDVYTDDSGLCRAALHAGVVTPQGGPITVTRRHGQPLYVGTTRSGVRSNDYGAYPYSIEFAGTPAPPAGPAPCPRTLAINRDLPVPFTCRCAAQATRTGTVWGTDVYTDDSALCRAAVHAGRVSTDGGTITVTRSAGRALYVGSPRNGVASNDYGAYPASIGFR